MSKEKLTNESTDEIYIDFGQLFRELLNHWFLIMFVTISAALGTFGFNKYYVLPEYESKSELWVLSKSTSITSLADVQLGANLSNDYRVVVKSRPVLEQVIANLSLDTNYKLLSAKVNVTNPSNTRILDITVRDTDPERAKMIADEIADVSSRFIAEKMDQDPPSVLMYGYSDEGPVAPSTFKNTALGGFVGFILVCGMLALFYMINDTVLTAEDVERKVGLSVIAQIPFDSEEESFGKQNHREGKR